MYYSQYTECKKCRGRAFIPCESCFCPTCIISSNVGKIKCNGCNSTGKTQKKFWKLSLDVSCNHCGGSGEAICPTCKGKGHLPSCDKCNDTGAYTCDECGGAGQLINEQFLLWVASLEKASPEILHIEHERRQLELTKLRIMELQTVQQEYQLKDKFDQAVKEFQKETEFFYSGDYFGDLYKNKKKGPCWNDWSQDINAKKAEINNQVGIIRYELSIIRNIQGMDKTKPNAFKLWKRDLDRNLISDLNERANLNISLHEATCSGNLQRN